jgi:hypothetical protein
MLRRQEMAFPGFKFLNKFGGKGEAGGWRRGERGGRSPDTPSYARPRNMLQLDLRLDPAMLLAIQGSTNHPHIWHSFVLIVLLI